jgi:hypothetical protein
MLVQDHGLSMAVRLAAIHNLRCVRPLAEILSLPEERGKRYLSSQTKTRNR